MAARKNTGTNPPDDPSGDPAQDALANAKKEAEFDPDEALKPRTWVRTQTVLNADVELAIIEAARAGHFRADQAIHGGVAPITLRAWMRLGGQGDERYQEFARRVHAAELEAKDRLIVKVKKGALRDVRAAMWLLEVRWKAQFAARVKVIHSTIKQERELMLDAVADLLDELEKRHLQGDQMEDLFDEFATRFDARLSEAKEATEEALEAELADD